jgi:GNAT superfamily N-acetyltransferase
MPMPIGLDAYRLELAQSPEDWAAYHAIRREAIFAALLPGVLYDPDYPDEFLPDHFPYVLKRHGEVVGVMRIDLIDAQRAGFRLIAVRPDLQRGGHGRVLMALAERRARELGRLEAVINAHHTALGFYLGLGYAEGAWVDAGPPPPGTVRVGKAL